MICLPLIFKFKNDIYLVEKNRLSSAIISPVSCNCVRLDYFNAPSMSPHCHLSDIIDAWPNCIMSGVLGVLRRRHGAGPQHIRHIAALHGGGIQPNIRAGEQHVRHLLHQVSFLIVSTVSRAVTSVWERHQSLERLNYLSHPHITHTRNSTLDTSTSFCAFTVNE